MRLGLGLGLGFRNTAAPAGGLITLSATSVPENATTGTTVGALSVVNGSGSYTFTETADPDNKFAVSGSNLNTSAALNYEAATSHSVTIQADNGVDDPITRTFVISVTNVFEAANLSALSGTFTLAEGAAQGASAGSITGKTSGSSLTLIDNAGGRVQLSGTTIQAGPTATDYEASTSHSFTVRETLADSANSPRVTVLTLTVTNVDETGPTDINAPSLALASITTYPPDLSVSLDETVAEGDTLRVQASASVGFGTLVFNSTAVLNATAISTGEVSIAGLSDIASPDQTYFRARVERGATVSPWSTIVKHGDAVAPTITSSATPSVAENTVNPTGTLTANEDIESWAKIGGADQALFSLDNAYAQSPTWTLNATPNFEVKTSYEVIWLATDYAGNTTTQTMTLAITDVAETSPSVLSSTYKNSTLTLSNGGLTVESVVANVGSPARVRSDQVRTGKRYYEVLVNNPPTFGAAIHVGVCTATISTTAFGPPPPDGSSFRSDGNAYPAPGSNVFLASYTQGDRVMVALDTATRLVWYGKNGTWLNGNPAAGTGGTVAHASATDFCAFIGLVPQTLGVNKVTVNFGATAFSYTIPTGFEAWT